MMNPGKDLSVWFLSSWYPTRVHPTRGNFVQKHAEAVSRYCKVSVLHVCMDPGLTKGSEFCFTERNGFNEIIIYLAPPRSGSSLFSGWMRYTLFSKAYKKGAELLTEKFGKPDIIHANVLYPVSLLHVNCQGYLKYPLS
jgi:L-malate glycosyltransferase